MESKEEQIARLLDENRQLKSNHANLVARNRILRDRLDLPVERIRVHEELVRLQEENEKLTKQLTTLKQGKRNE